MTLRDATEADLPAIVEIHNAAIASRISTAQLEPVRVEERRDWLRAHSPQQYPLWVVQTDDAIAVRLSFGEFLPRRAYRGTVELSGTGLLSGCQDFGSSSRSLAVTLESFSSFVSEAAGDDVSVVKKRISRRTSAIRSDGSVGEGIKVRDAVANDFCLQILHFSD